MTNGGEHLADLEVLPPEFFARNALAVARDLLGCLLISRGEEGVVGGVITDTEAYAGVLDRACHAHAFHRSARNQSMYALPGTAYVYLVYGLHNCFNVSCLAEDRPHAVLVRGLWPRWGLGIMGRRRGISPLTGGAINPSLCDGPGKLCQALGVERTHDGIFLPDGNDGLLLLPGVKRGRYEALPRVGIESSGEFASVPWRFVATRPNARRARG
ncbi:MAG: DNA-3-methyladenine glycosylase [Bacillota bacterium]